jgi:hypothetical protein
MTLILTTMVRNEEKALPRLLRSVANIVTHVALTDTGSTDNTLRVAREVCAELGLVLSIAEHPWRDFGHNRTLNLVHGRSVAMGLDAPLDSSYLLLLDADMEVPPGVVPLEEYPDVGMLAQCDGQATWWNVRIIRASVPATYVGRTHEYISHSAPMVKINWFTIDDHCDGGCRSDKFERDERLLRLDLAEKNDARSMYYLAQTLKCLGRKNEAKELYLRRAQYEDFPEEAYMARAEASRCADGDEADMLALKAYASRPQRVETLAEVAQRACDRGEHKFALWLADIGGNTPFPKDETLYIGASAYRWVFPYVNMVSSYYAGDHERGMRACEELHFVKGSPYAQVALDNVLFYAKQINGTRRPLPFTPPDGFAPASPCLKKLSTGWIGIIRAVNYKISAEGYFPLIAGGWADSSRPITTRNHVVWYDDDFNLMRVQEMFSPKGSNPQSQIVGFEDQRIVAVDQHQMVMAGVRCDCSPVGVPELWESTWDLQTGQYVCGRKISKGANVEKNWLPVEDGYLYGHNPITFVDCDGEFKHSVSSSIDLSGFRGSSAPIDYKGGKLYLVHEVSHRGRRTYLHRFVYAEKDWSQITISRPFYMEQLCMESCFSINATDMGIVMSCAFEDSRIYTITVAHEELYLMLDQGTKA